MITQLDQSGGKVLGFAASGDVTKDDFAVLLPTVEKAISEYGSISLLLDLRDFHWEKVDAWASDMRFGRELHDKIERMAIVGDHTWQKHLARLAQPFYAKEAKYFEQADPGWAWVKG
jgi:hypothetical protein